MAIILDGDLEIGAKNYKRYLLFELFKAFAFSEKS